MRFNDGTKIWINDWPRFSGEQVAAKVSVCWHRVWLTNQPVCGANRRLQMWRL